MKTPLENVIVVQLQKGMKTKDAHFSLACRMRGRKLKGWSYDSRTGKARAF